MFWEFKSGQTFVEKTKLPNNLFMENLNHPINYVQQTISKITKETTIGRILKWSKICWKSQTHKQFVRRKLD